MAEIRNPNLQTPGGDGGGSGGDMRGMFTIMLLVLLVFFGFDYFKARQQPLQTPSTPSQSQAPSQQQAQPVVDQSQSTQPQPAAAAAQPQTALPTISAQVESLTTIENEQYKIVFTNRGAQIKSWVLKKYFDTAGKPLDMVQPQAAQAFGYPLSLFTYEPALTTELNQALYQVTASGAQPSSTGNAVAPATDALTFHYAIGGLDVVKTIRFDSSYAITIEAAVKRNGSPVRALVEWPAGLGDMEEFLPSSSTRSPVRTSASSTFIWSLNGKQDSVGPMPSSFLFWSHPGVSDGETLNLPYSYAAISDLYFVSAFLPDAPDRTTVVTLHHAIDLPRSLSDPKSEKTPAHLLGLAMGDVSGTTRLRLFAGPKAMDVLASIRVTGPDGKPTGQTLESLVQFGWLTVIAKPLYLALRYLVEHGVNSWGWSIIVVTVIFNLLMLPTRYMMLKSSYKMTRMQPKIEAIKNRYKNVKATDPKRAEMNTEIMELYKTEGVNMYGGCLPLIIQMPLFFAYFRVLQNTVELRQAHWFWLRDLSAPDPLHILPILIIITMFLTQYITPSPQMDKSQQRMMAFMMPAIFGFMLWSYASGLALYWGTGNIINLAIQVAINQTHMGKEMHAHADRRNRKGGSGGPKTIQGRR
ncbi:MAG: membrane protein insertase YidC [Terracidiphilus sp.]